MDGVAPACNVERAGSGSLHAVAEARLRYRLTVSCRGRLVAVAIRLLRGHGDAGARCQHQLGCACNAESTGNLSHSDHIELKLPGRTSTLLVFMLLAVKKTCFYLKSSKGTDESFSQSTASCSCSTARCFLPKLEVSVCDFSLSHLLSASKSCNRGATTHGRLSSQLCIWLMHPETFQYSSPCKNVLNAIWKDI